MRKIALLLIFALLFQNLSAQTGETTFRSINEQETIDSLHLLAWNIYMLPPIVKFTGKKKRARLIGEILNASDYDVIVFTEAFHKRSRKLIHSKMKENYPYFEGPAFRKKFSLVASSGIWIASKFPMHEVGKIIFKAKSGLDNKMSRKGALMVRVDKNGQKFDVIGTHMNNMGPLQVRYAQLIQIKEELIDTYADEETPVIVAGDFNIYRHAEPGAADTTAQILDMDIYELSGEEKMTYDYINNKLAYGKVQDELDYVFYRPGKLQVKGAERTVPSITRHWKKRKKDLSDHYPVRFMLYYER